MWTALNADWLLKSLFPAWARCLQSTSHLVGDWCSAQICSKVAVELFLIIFNSLRCLLTSLYKECFQKIVLTALLSLSTSMYDLLKLLDILFYFLTSGAFCTWSRCPETCSGMGQFCVILSLFAVTVQVVPSSSSRKGSYCMQSAMLVIGCFINLLVKRWTHEKKYFNFDVCILALHFFFIPCWWLCNSFPSVGHRYLRSRGQSLLYIVLKEPSHVQRWDAGVL